MTDVVEPDNIKPDQIHVDSWVRSAFYGEGTDEEAYAKLFFFYKRLPVVTQAMWRPHLGHLQLYCTYKDKRYRVTGASRMGDIYLTENLEQEIGYDLRVSLDYCSGWGKTP